MINPIWIFSAFFGMFTVVWYIARIQESRLIGNLMMSTMVLIMGWFMYKIMGPPDNGDFN